jgi:hypothetical protein
VRFPKRADDISRYLSAGNGSIPTNVVLSAQLDAQLQYIPRSKTISFSRVPRAFLAKEYAKSHENTLVVSPDDRSRIEINERIHAELQDKGRVSGEEHPIRTLVPRQELTGVTVPGQRSTK